MTYSAIQTFHDFLVIQLYTQKFIICNAEQSKENMHMPRKFGFNTLVIYPHFLKYIRLLRKISSSNKIPYI